MKKISLGVTEDGSHPAKVWMDKDRFTDPQHAQNHAATLYPVGRLRYVGERQEPNSGQTKYLLEFNDE